MSEEIMMSILMQRGDGDDMSPSIIGTKNTLDKATEFIHAELKDIQCRLKFTGS